ncbi:DUF5789 family protein [Halobacterium litoreum]|uniref:DUF2795 domain-containing protein n=1 Tax=Halobacterium litoreum TaxID=2039234 RepID=A0ABD5NEV7_9EURY|nr:hypothetical protein [Halobacterium litoreum]UHH13333.1 hypothetical protein LT972_14390 [Halobacterium litoreum]
MTLRETADVLTAQDYPLTAAELASACGDHELDEADGGETLRAVIARTGEDRFETATEATFAVYGAVGESAVGRVGYSDRDPTPMGVDGPEPVSF